MAPKPMKKLPVTEPEGRKRCSSASQARPTQDSDNEGPSQIPSSQSKQRKPPRKFDAAEDLGFPSDEDMEGEVTVVKFHTTAIV